MVSNSMVENSMSENSMTMVPSEEDYQTNDEKKLLNYLMRNYDKRIRPVKNVSSPVLIRLGITLTQIVDLVSYISW